LAAPVHTALRHGCQSLRRQAGIAPRRCPRHPAPPPSVPVPEKVRCVRAPEGSLSAACPSPPRPQASESRAVP